MTLFDAKRLLGLGALYRLAEAGLAFVVTSRNVAALAASAAPATLTVGAPAEYAGTYPLDPSALADGPVALRAPGIVGTPRVGRALDARPALWAHDGGRAEPVRGWRWQRDGAEIAGATGPAYLVQPGDAGRLLRVVETAADAGGSAQAISPSVLIQA